jgi:hypothetical protein
MNIEIHLGLHKTGTTYIQTMLNQNHEILKKYGVYYERQTRYPAHNWAAWRILIGDCAPLARMVADARRAGCETLLFSAEDLSPAIFSLPILSGIRAVARQEGADLTFHVCIRRQDEMFWSHYHEFSGHHFCDPYYFFYEVMRNGYYSANMVNSRGGEKGNPFAMHCFDYLRYLGDFGKRVEGALKVYDFADNDPFPTWRMLEELGVPWRSLHHPGNTARNARLTDAVVEGQYLQRVLDILPKTSATRPDLLAVIKQRWQVPNDIREIMSGMLMERFGAENAELLHQYGITAPCPTHGATAVAAASGPTA